MEQAVAAMAQPAKLIEGVGRYTRSGRGHPVVVLSNPQADPNWWVPPFASAFADAGYETIPFVHTGEIYAPQAVVRDVTAFVEHLETEPVRVLGWSQGAAIAQEVVLLRPDLVAGAALIAGYGRQNSIDRLVQDAWATLAAGGPELDPVRQVLLLLTSYPAELLGEDASAAPLIAGARSWAAKSASADEARRRSAAFIAGYQERLADLARIQVPCLVVGFRLDADAFVSRTGDSKRHSGLPIRRAGAGGSPDAGGQSRIGD